jgi:hypothetical protein
MGLSCTIAAGPRQRSHSQVRVQRNLWPHFISQFRDLPNLEGQVPVFISPRNRVVRLYPQALGSSFRRLLRLAGLRWTNSNLPPHGLTKILSLESYVTTDGQSAGLSLNKASIWCLRLDFYYCQAVAICWCGALSLTRGRICSLQLLLALLSAVILGSGSRGTRVHILLSQIRDFPFRRLLRLAGLRWRHLTPPPRGIHLYVNCL